MTTRDKTREKLLGSMRKTKEVIEGQADTKQAHAQTYTQPATSAGTKTTPKKTKGAGPTAALQTESVADPYQSTGRVWPD